MNNPNDFHDAMDQPGPDSASPYREREPIGSVPKADGVAIASLVIGISSVVTSCIPLIGLAAGIVAIVMFVKFNGRFKTSGGQLGGKGLAIAGLVTGIVGTVFGVLYTIYWLFIGIIVGSAASGPMLFKN